MNICLFYLTFLSNINVRKAEPGGASAAEVSWNFQVRWRSPSQPLSGEPGERFGWWLGFGWTVCLFFFFFVFLSFFFFFFSALRV